MREALEKAGIRLQLSPGDIVTVKDKDVKFPEDPERKTHIRRFCVILSSDLLCEKSPLLSILPLSHQVGLMSFCDVKIVQTRENGLDCDSHAAMEQIQPILRTSVIERKGKLSLDAWEEIMTQMIRNFDRA